MDFHALCESAVVIYPSIGGRVYSNLCVCVCVCVLPRILGDSFVSLLVEPIAGKKRESLLINNLW